MINRLSPPAPIGIRRWAQHALETDRVAVTITDGIMDSTITNESQFNDDWDGNWKHAVSEDGDTWSAEMLIPWYIAPMRGGEDGTRTRMRIGGQPDFAVPVDDDELAVRREGHPRNFRHHRRRQGDFLDLVGIGPETRRRSEREQEKSNASFHFFALGCIVMTKGVAASASVPVPNFHRPGDTSCPPVKTTSAPDCSSARK